MAWRSLWFVPLLGLSLAQGLKEGLMATVEPLLQGLEGQAQLLAQEAKIYAQSPTSEGLYRLRLLWHSARDYWEELEAFAFGPMGDYDAYLDTWPISPEDLQRSAGVPVEALPPEVRGFHALEYLLFRELPKDPARAQQLVLLAQDLASRSRELRKAYEVYLRQVSDQELSLELYAASLELAEELFSKKLKDPESPYAQRSAEDYRANGRGLAKALALIPSAPWGLVRDLQVALAALPSPLEGAWGDPRVMEAQAKAHALHRLLAQTPIEGARERLRLWLRTFREEYLGEDEVDEALAALEALRAALKGVPREEEAQRLLEILRAKVEAGATAEEVEPILRALEGLLP